MGALAALLFLFFLFLAFRKKFRRQMERDRGNKTESYKRVFKVLLLTIAPVILSATVYNLCGVVDNAMFGTIMSIQGHKESEYAALAERAFVRTLDGGCSSPIAAYAQIHGTELKLTGLYAKEHQWEYVIDSVTGNTENAVQLGEQLAQTMKGRL